MEDGSKNISIPIRSIVEQSMNKNGARYMEDEFNLLIKYFIACLNLRYLLPKDLTVMVDKFSEKIKFIVLNYNSINNLDYYKIIDGVLYINGNLKYSSPQLYEITFYKAVTETVFKCDSKYVSFNNCEFIKNTATEGIKIIYNNFLK